MPETAAITANRVMQQTAAPDAQEIRKKAHEAQGDHDTEQSQKRRPLYDDVETLVSIGFLSHQVSIDSVNLSMRSLGPGDLFLLRHRCGRVTSDWTWRLWAVSSAVWMVNGMSLLEDGRAANKIHDSLKHLPRATVDILFSIVMGLLNRSSRAVSRTEAYCYEPYSRINWRLGGRQIPSQDYITGIPGSTRVGLNHVQRMWLAFNLAEDDRLQYLREWQAAKLVASASASKGIKKLNRTDESLRNQEESRRRRVMEQMCHFALYGEDGEEANQPWRVVVQGQVVDVEPVKVASSAEELEDQFRRWVAGEKDWHDIIVDTYKDRIKAQFDKEREAREAAMAQHQRQEPGVDAQTHLVGYTLDEIKELRKDLLTPVGGRRRVFDNSQPSALFNKYVAQDAEPGRLMVEGDRVVEAPRQEQEPLQDQVARRRPSISTEPIGPTQVEGGE